MPAQGVELAVRGSGDGQGSEAREGPKGEAPATGLHVVFSVTSAYTKGARLCHEDALRSSLPSFEATPANNFQQLEESRPSPETASDTPSATSACSATADNSSSALRPPATNPAGLISDRRPPSSGLAIAPIAPCLSTPPIAKGCPSATRPGVEKTAPTGTRATAAVPKVLARSPSNTTTGRTEGGSVGGVVEGELSQKGGHGGRPDRLAGVTRADQNRPGYGRDSGRRDSRERTTGDSGRCLRDQLSPIPPKSGSPLGLETRDLAKKATGDRGSTHIVMADNPAADPYHAQQRRERGADRIIGMVGGENPSTGRLRWNSAWEQQDLAPPSPESAPVPPTSHRPTLPYIQRHVDNASPQSAFGHQDSSGGWGKSDTPRDTSVGGDSYIRPPEYYAHEPPVQRNWHEPPGRAEDKSFLRYHRPVREQRHHAFPRHGGHQGYFSDGQRDTEPPTRHRSGEATRGRGGVFTGKVDWNQRRYPDKHPPGVVGTDHRLQPGNRIPWGGNDVQHPPRAGDNRRSRWREEDDEGWIRSGPPDRRKSEQDVYRQGGGLNGEEEDPRQYRSDHRGRRNKVPSLSDSRRGGYNYGGGLPPSGKLCWEQTKAAAAMAASAALSDPSRGSAVARGRVVTGREGRDEPSEDELEEQEAYYARKRGSYSRPLASDRQARRGVGNGGGSESVRQYLYLCPSLLLRRTIVKLLYCCARVRCPITIIVSFVLSWTRSRRL